MKNTKQITPWSPQDHPATEKLINMAIDQPVAEPPKRTNADVDIPEFLSSNKVRVLPRGQAVRGWKE